jgi:hypothetical protein
MGCPARPAAAALILTILTIVPTAAQQPAGAAGELRAGRAARPPVIDGRITDAQWADADPVSVFTQRDPDEGRPATERTELRVLYDDDALYVAARLFDSNADLISRRMSGRDEIGNAADSLTVYLDSMHDHLTGAVFTVSAANVQEDAILYNDSWTDGSWDAVWDSAVSVDAEGWSVEMRIPLSQLRFPAADRHTWGVNASRYIQRKNEHAWLEMVPKNDNGLASRMPHLVGLDGIQPARNLELLPYTAARAEFVQPRSEDDPFNDGLRGFAAAGADLKWGMTSNLTVNATVNPDFGQVEVDPAVVNLTAFETFFDEKRPFFLEGAQIFNNFGTGGSNSFWGFNMTDPNILYSRRIGRAPQLAAAGDYVDPPVATTILGAAKLTGKTGGGWQLGLLEAVTAEESARVRTTGFDGTAPVEPMTNYFTARLQREVGARAGAGVIVTAVNRRLNTPAFASTLARSAYVAGGDAHLFLDRRRDWVLTGKAAVSYVSGTTQFLQRLQRAPQRYFQRPDAPHVSLSPAATSLSGVSGRLVLNRNSGAWQVNAQLWGVSPGFESNDIGFLGTGDRAGAHAVVTRRWNVPGRLVRSRFMWVSKWWAWNYGRQMQGDGLNSSLQHTFVNYWNLNLNGGLRWRTQDDRLTRGGPTAESPGGGYWNVNGGTDSRRAVSFYANTNYNWNEYGGWSRNWNLSVELRPSPMVMISTGPQWNRSNALAQYVLRNADPTAGATYGARYVFGELDQSQLTMTTRVNLTLTPTVSLQVYAQPLIAVGEYDTFKELATPGTFDFFRYGIDGGTLEFDSESNRYTVDPDAGGPADQFSFGNPDFNLKSLRVNAVFRWEFRPGSRLYAVWTRQQQDTNNPGGFALSRDTRALFSAPGDDVVLVKVSYWLGR